MKRKNLYAFIVLLLFSSTAASCQTTDDFRGIKDIRFAKLFSEVVFGGDFSTSLLEPEDKEDLAGLKYGTDVRLSEQYLSFFFMTQMLLPQEQSETNWALLVGMDTLFSDSITIAKVLCYGASIYNPFEWPVEFHFIGYWDLALMGSNELSLLGTGLGGYLFWKVNTEALFSKLEYDVFNLIRPHFASLDVGFLLFEVLTLAPYVSISNVMETLQSITATGLNLQFRPSPYFDIELNIENYYISNVFDLSAFANFSNFSAEIMKLENYYFKATLMFLDVFFISCWYDQKYGFGIGFGEKIRKGAKPLNTSGDNDASINEIITIGNEMKSFIREMEAGFYFNAITDEPALNRSVGFLFLMRLFF
ncbi:MAG: hypothetical protein JW969_02450 [Spirochaetales bacterium]|nr:hypothetical protein [Spirochaetales bacterium]